MNPYSEEYYAQSKQRYRLKEYLAAQFKTWLQPRPFAKLINQLPEGAKVLDIGCGKGELLNKLSQYRPDLDCYGVDFTPATPYPGYQHIRGDATQLPFDNEQFDLVISKQLIEHMQDGSTLIAELQRVLKPGGYGYLDCPDVRGTSPLIHPNFYDDPTHVRPYTCNALQRLFELHQLKPIKCGRLRDWRLTILGLGYFPVAIIMRDKKFLPGYLGHLFGLWIYITAQKSNDRQ